MPKPRPITTAPHCLPNVIPKGEVVLLYTLVPQKDASCTVKEIDPSTYQTKISFKRKNLATLGLSFSMQDLPCNMQDLFSMQVLVP